MNVMFKSEKKTQRNKNKTEAYERPNKFFPEKLLQLNRKH